MVNVPSRSAIHEGAHAFVAVHFGGTVRYCEVFSAGGGRHRAVGVPHDRWIHVKLAGLVAERVLDVEHANLDLCEKDIAKAVKIALRAARGDEAQADARIEAAEHELEALFAANKGAILSIAAKLDADGTLDDETLRAIVAEVPV